LEIARIKHETQKDVEIERLNLRKKIQSIKKNTLRKQKLLEQQINLIRTQMAKNLLDANKIGDMNICKNGAKDPVKIQNYCDLNFVDSFTKKQRVQRS